MIECEDCQRSFADRPAYVVHRGRGGDFGGGAELCMSPVTFGGLLVQEDTEGVPVWRIRDKWRLLAEAAR